MFRDIRSPQDLVKSFRSILGCSHRRDHQLHSQTSGTLTQELKWKTNAFSDRNNQFRYRK